MSALAQVQEFRVGLEPVDLILRQGHPALRVILVPAARQERGLALASVRAPA